MEDGAHTIYLSTKGKNEDEVSRELVRFLEFVGSSLQDSEKDFEDEFVSRLQSSVKEVKASREMGARYMTFEEYIQEERLEERIKIAKNMFEKGLPIEDIAAWLELTKEEIQYLLELTGA